LSDFRSLIRRTGFDLSRWPLASSFPGHIKALLDWYRITLVIDVGANVGQFGQSLRDVSGYSGRIESFEPFSASFQQLAIRSAADAFWNPHQVALGSCDFTANLNLYEGSDWNSLHRPNVEHLALAGRSLVQIGSERVEVRCLDSIWSQIVGHNDVVLLKSDTQGHDLEVLRGAGDRLTSVSALVLEVSVTTFYEGEPGLVEIMQSTRDLGFVPSGFFPVTRRRGSLGLDTLDACFVRDDPAT
jgi:FkbM family methyltransferase